jgi:predicted kinase
VSVLIQMHGHPGSGKSAFARALGAALPAVVVDKDVVASALIRAGIPWGEAGAPAYQVMYAQAARFLADGHAVVMDSPCFWPIIEETTRRIAAEADVPWLMIETLCPDDVRDARLAVRVRLESNPVERDLGPMRPGMYLPECERLVLDSTVTMDEMVVEALAYVANRGPALTPGKGFCSPDSCLAGEGRVRVEAAVAR